jgi:hypothetical protein
MQPQQQFGFKELYTYVLGETARAICERPGENQQQRLMRTQAATHMILGLRPRDVTEAMLGCLAVMFHALLTDSVHDTLQGQIDDIRRATRVNIVSLNKAFHMNLGRLEHYQARPSQGTRDGSEDAAMVETEAEDRAKPSTAEAVVHGAVAHGARAPAATAMPVRMAPPIGPTPSEVEETLATFVPSAAQIAACRANPEAMAALETGDAERFARALGIDQPSEAYLEAAAGLPVDGKGRGDGGRNGQPGAGRPGSVPSGNGRS